MKYQRDFLRYFEQVEAGDIVVCDKVARATMRALDEIRNPAKWHYDEAMAAKHIDFMERFCMTAVGSAPRPISFEPFQKSIIAHAYGMVDDEGIRKYFEELWMMARKNGKTTVGAALEVDAAFNDGEYAPHIYNAATSKDQAMESYEPCYNMLKLNPLLWKKTNKPKSKDVGKIELPFNLGRIERLSGRPNSMDGFNVHFALIDELAAHKTRDIYDLLKQGISARTQPLIWCITTNGFVRQSIFDAQYDYASKWLDGLITDDSFFAWLYELDSPEEWEDPACWIKPNPGLGTIKKERFLLQNVEKAKNDPEYRPTVMVKDFNMKENASSAWLSWQHIENPERYEFADMGFRYGIAGFDAADSIDLTAACVFCMRPGDDRIYKRSMYWLPQTVIDEAAEGGSRAERDGVPYTQWVKRGLMRAVPGNKVPKGVLLEWLIELRDEEDLYTYAIGYDPWHIDDATKHDLEMFVGKDNLIVVRQGARTMSDPMKSFKADLKANRIVNNDHPIDQWCRLNAAVRTDVNNNIQLDKKNNDKRNRIDGMVAELCAYIVLQNRFAEYQNII